MITRLACHWRSDVDCVLSDVNSLWSIEAIWRRLMRPYGVMAITGSGNVLLLVALINHYQLDP